MIIINTELTARPYAWLPPISGGIVMGRLDGKVAFITGVALPIDGGQLERG